MVWLFAFVPLAAVHYALWRWGMITLHRPTRRRCRQWLRVTGPVLGFLALGLLIEGLFNFSSSAATVGAVSGLTLAYLPRWLRRGR